MLLLILFFLIVWLKFISIIEQFHNVLEKLDNILFLKLLGFMFYCVPGPIQNQPHSRIQESQNLNYFVNSAALRLTWACYYYDAYSADRWSGGGTVAGGTRTGDRAASACTCVRHNSEKKIFRYYWIVYTVY